MRQLSVVITLAFTMIAVACAESDAASKGLLTNNGKKKWVSRRDKTDPNKSGDIAAVLKIVDDPNGNNDAVLATLWVYASEANGDYVLRTKYDNLKGAINPGQGNSRKRETCVLKNQLGTVTVWISLFKNKGKGRPHQRVIMRYKETTLDAEGKPKKKTIVPCEEEPNEDVLEEEPIDPDMEDLDYVP